MLLWRKFASTLKALWTRVSFILQRQFSVLIVTVTVTLWHSLAVNYLMIWFVLNLALAMLSHSLGVHYYGFLNFTQKVALSTSFCCFQASDPCTTHIVVVCHWFCEFVVSGILCIWKLTLLNFWLMYLQRVLPLKNLQLFANFSVASDFSAGRERYKRLLQQFQAWLHLSQQMGLWEMAVTWDLLNWQHHCIIVDSS